MPISFLISKKNPFHLEFSKDYNEKAAATVTIAKNAIALRKEHEFFIVISIICSYVVRF